MRYKVLLPLLLTAFLVFSISSAVERDAASVKFTDAKITKDGGGFDWQSVDVVVKEFDTGNVVYSGKTPATLPLAICTIYTVKIPRSITYEEDLKEYTWHDFPDTHWTVTGPATIDPTTGGGPRHLLFKLHAIGTSDVTLEPKYSRGGAAIDRVRFDVVKSPDAQLIAMQTGAVDIVPGLIRTGDIEKLDADGFTITATPGFHMGHFGINIRPDQTYKTKGNPLLGPILSDVNFRHAILHCYNQEEIVASIYKYIAAPVRSLVPPALGGWVNPEVEAHPYNPGDPAGTTAWNPSTGENEDACSILRYGGYTYSAGEWTAPYDLDGDTVNDVIPAILLWTPTSESAPSSAEHGARFSMDCNAIGIPIVHSPREFSPYVTDVFGGAHFDMYMAFWELGRFPDHLYDLCHSSQDCAVWPWRYNAPGIDNADMDAAIETLKFSLDHEAKLLAAYEAQRMLYDFDPSIEDNPAGSYLQLYSRVAFNAFAPGLKGIVNSPGYGADNWWTFSNMRWEPSHPNERIEDGETVVIFAFGGEPDRLNPTYGRFWKVMPCFDGLIDFNPYTLEDLPNLAKDWEIEAWATDEEVDSMVVGTYPIVGSNWYEDWPEWSTPWLIIDWIDTNADGVPSLSDYVQLNDLVWYHMGEEPRWEIKIENATFCNEQDSIEDMEMKLHNVGVDAKNPFVDGPITDPTAVNDKTWHELWPNYCTPWTVTDWQDDDASGSLTKRDYLRLNDGCWYHVDSVTVSLALDEEPEDTVIDKYIEFAGTGQKLIYLLREDVFWQDGNPYTAEDAQFNLLFMRDNQIPRYTSGWEHIVDVDTVRIKTTETNEYVYPSAKLVVYLDMTSQFLLYDIAAMAALLPPPVWAEWNGLPQATILGRDLSAEAGPQTDPNAPWYCPTNLYGTGMFIFEFYDPVGLYAEVRNNRNYWKTTESFHAEKVEMLHRIGDVDRDGEIGIFDLSRMGVAYFTWPPNPLYDADADVNSDGICDIRDIALTSYFYGDQREYPYP